LAFKISVDLSRLAVDEWRKDFAVALGFAFQSWHFWQLQRFWQWLYSRSFAAQNFVIPVSHRRRGICFGYWPFMISVDLRESVAERFCCCSWVCFSILALLALLAMAIRG